MSHWDEALQHLLWSEGGLKEHAPHERIVEAGGAANFGITVCSYLDWKHKRGELLEIETPERNEFSAPGVQSLKAITKDEVHQFYWDQYGAPMHLGEYKGRLTAIALLDQAVNRGKGGVKKGLMFTMNKRYGHAYTEASLFTWYVDAINQIEDRKFFHQFLSDAQDNYVAIVKRDISRLSDLPGWLNRSQILLGLLV